jgi:hypothetical protein
MERAPLPVTRRRTSAWLVAVWLVAAAVVLVAACPSRSRTVDARRSTGFLRGVGLGLFATDPAYDYAPMLDEIVAHGATDVLVAVVWYQDDVRAHEIRRRPGFSPADQTVLRTLRAAKERGLRAALLPIVRLEHHTPTEWRGRIDPAAGVDAWFASYEAFVTTMADLAQQGGAARMGVGSELLSMEKHDPKWRGLIARVRARYDGKLFYSANWDHYRPVRFWDALDEVAVTAYFELTRDAQVAPSDDDVRRAWEGPLDDLARFAAETRKPLFVSEIGYPSKTTAARYPWDETRGAPSDPALQARLYASFCDAFSRAGVVDGVFFWNWFGFGGAGDDTYTPRGKPAAKAMERCLRDAPWDRRRPIF